MSFLGRIFLGTGTFKAELRAELEAEGVALIVEGVPGKIRYAHFKAPGKRFNGKVTLVRLALAVTEERFVVYSNSGKAELIDSAYSSPNWQMADLAAEPDRLEIRVDYDRSDISDVSGQITITANTDRAREIAEQIRARSQVSARDATSPGSSSPA